MKLIRKIMYALGLTRFQFYDKREAQQVVEGLLTNATPFTIRHTADGMVGIKVKGEQK